MIDLDLKSYFDTIDHELLVKLVMRRVRDPRILRLIRLWLRAGVMHEGVWEESVVGTPQGGVISPLLSNIYLDPLDLNWEWQMRDTQMVRYAEDLSCSAEGGVPSSPCRFSGVSWRISS